MKKLLRCFMLCSFGILTLASNPREALFNKAKDNLFRNPEKTIKISNPLLKDESDVNKKAELYLTLSKAYIANAILISHYFPSPKFRICWARLPTPIPKLRF